MEIKHGCTRFVFLTKKYAIKIPQFKYGWKHFLLGLLANLQEVSFSKINDERLCPIKFYIPGGWLLIMPKCELISREVFFDLDISRFWPNNKEDYHPNNTCERVEYNVPVENKQDSFGYLNGKIVAIDYGS
ncbi:MAG: hypothetical protein ACOC56_05045 [Atribacterota bacterium]